MKPVFGQLGRAALVAGCAALLVTGCAAAKPNLNSAVMACDVPFAQERLAAGELADAKNSGAPMVYWAALAANSEMIRLLVAKGAKVDETNGSGMTALVGLVQNGKEPEEMVADAKKANEQVIKNVGEAMAKEYKWHKSTDLALYSTIADRAKTLIELGADPNFVYAKEWTPFLLAVDKQNLSLVNVMLQSKKVNVELRFHQWAEAAIAVSQSLGLDLSPGKGRYASMDDKDKAKFWAGVPQFETPLIFAVGKKNIELVRALVEAGANLNNGRKIAGPAAENARTFDIEGPLDRALKEGDTAIVEYLKSKGAQPMTLY